MKARAAVFAVFSGAAATFVAAAVVGMSWHDSVRILGIAAVGALVAAPIAGVAFLLTRRLSVAVQVSVISCVAVLVCGTALVAAARAMFVSDHDAEVLIVVLLAAATTGIAAALAFASRYGSANRALQSAARRIGDGDFSASIALDRPASAEMRSLAHELDTMARRLAAAREREQALDADRRELIAWLSHDLRAPIAGLVAVTEALQDGLVSDATTQHEYLATIRSEAVRLADLIDQLFDLSLLESNSASLRVEPTAIGDVVSDALAAARLLADAKHVAVAALVPDELPIVEVDPRGISRILANFLDNAIRHTPAGGTITVETRCDHHHICISVADECGGIPQRDVERIFDVAYRGDEARTPHSTARGGMGLTIARGIARAHHGDITVRNHAGGCTFSLLLTLPRTDGPRRPSRRPDPVSTATKSC
jgi:signal transduction histidine kinase